MPWLGSPLSYVLMGFVILFAVDVAIALVVLGFFFWGLTDWIGFFFQHSALARVDRSGRSDLGRQLDTKGDRSAAYCEWSAGAVGLARMPARFLLSCAYPRARALELIFACAAG